MSALDPRPPKAPSQELEEAPRSDLDADGPSPPEEKKSGHSRWLMIACCVPMLAIAVILVATGVASAGLIVVAVFCTAMMAMMMMGMSGGGR